MIAVVDIRLESCACLIEIPRYLTQGRIFEIHHLKSENSRSHQWLLPVNKHAGILCLITRSGRDAPTRMSKTKAIAIILKSSDLLGN